MRNGEMLEAAGTTIVPVFFGGVMSGRIPTSVFLASVVLLIAIAVAMVRFGILPLVVMLLVYDWLSTFPLTLDLRVWYSSKVLIAKAAVAAATIWSFRHALGGRRVLRADLVDA